MDYFRNCVTDISDFKRLEKLAHVLQRVRHLRVFSLGYKLRCASASSAGSAGPCSRSV